MKQKLIRATALTMSMLMLGVTALTGCSNQEEGKTTTSSTTEASTAKDTGNGYTGFFIRDRQQAGSTG